MICTEDEVPPVIESEGDRKCEGLYKAYIEGARTGESGIKASRVKTVHRCELRKKRKK